MPLTAHEFDRLVTKFGFETKYGRDLHAWLIINDNIVVRTRRSKKSSGDLPMSHSIRQQLKLSNSQLQEAISCKLDRDAYVEILRAKGLLGESSSAARTPDC